MPSPYDQEIEDLLALYARQREEAAETRRRIAATTATATDPRQAVKVTVGAQGELTAVEFPTGAYRRMAPKELADLLVTTAARAREEALEMVAGVVSDGLPPGVTVGDLLQGRVDPAALLPEDPALADAVREYVEHGFEGADRG
ncbi:YbaB/EbfC family nucleoid-associated protein [Streptomyces kaniharaensis]|uniref:YbaB/EbfC family nucleoid-associated protein n=1 Tax=Streptomyces kaniharaensis TaxID=212423 RepID=A0A6N7KX14_9ACTN|nr:YbaB/EbfC family nucleoid-associated protein [Streptomyces kaniharaensis]MQS16216.1 YbaB/EbfC family nucleoid-associated protein [Streptomyces kaniharaensis]